MTPWGSERIDKGMSPEDRDVLMFKAMKVLMDPSLVWSQDLEVIRPALGALFLKAMSNQHLAKEITTLAERLASIHE